MARAGKTGGRRSSFGKRQDADNAFHKARKERPGKSSGDEKRSGYKSGPRSYSSARPTGSRGPRKEGGDGDSARPRSFSRPSSGPRSYGEKRPFKSRDEGSSERPSRYSSSSGPRTRSGGDDSKRPYKKREEGSSERPRSFGAKRPFRSREEGSSERPSRYSSSSGPRTRSGGDDSKRPYKKREEGSSERPGSFGAKRPFKSRDEGSSERPSRYAGSGRPRTSAGGDDSKRPYKKREEGSSERPRFSKEGGAKRSYGSRDENPFKRRDARAGGGFKPGGSRGADQDKDDVAGAAEGGEKRPKREYKSFVESRIEKSKEQSVPGPSVRKAEQEANKDPELIRLNKFISNSGVCSRREADDLIKMGLVSVNGKTITEMGFKVKITDDIQYEGKRLRAEKPVYILLNKPKGYITTTDDPEDRNTVMQIIAGACKERVYPVGRLDRNTTGLLLLTNDGDLADKLTHPSYNAKKIYKVELDRPLTKADFQRIADGIMLEEGKAMVDDLAIVSEDSMTVGIELHIGWNHVVRRIFEALQYQVVKLDRVVYAGLDKKDLKRGQWRFLRNDEIVRLKHFKG